ncbi:MAG: helix-turn-helix transcriptional regulator [Oryzihumus sp.]
MEPQGADAADTAGTDLAGSGAAPTPGRDAASDWAAITELTGELSSRTARVIGRALTGRVDAGRVRLLGEDAAAVRTSMASLEPATRRSAWKLSRGSADPRSLVVDLNNASRARGIDLRLVLDLVALTRPIAAADQASRDRVRLAPVHVQMMLLDEQLVVVEGPVLRPFGGPSGWLMDEPGITAAACALWQETWARSAPLPAEALVMSDRQRAVASGLIDGETDAAIARRLRVSTRTVAAEVRVLMNAVGASSRYQAAMRLHRP